MVKKHLCRRRQNSYVTWAKASDLGDGIFYGQNPRDFNAIANFPSLSFRVLIRQRQLK